MHLVRIEASRGDLGALLELADVHVVAPSAIDRGDGTWLVSAYVTDAGADAIRGRGLTVHPVKDVRQMRDEWAAAARGAPARAAADCPSGYLDSASIRSRLEALAGAHGDVCVLDVLPHRTHEG